MEILKYAAVYGTGFLTVVILEYVWLGIILKDFIIKEFGNHIAVTNGKINIFLPAGIFAWLLICAIVLIFVTFKYDNYPSIILYGAILGAGIYGIYDLTNLTFLTNYSIKFTIIDILWGSFVCMMLALTSYTALNLFSKNVYPS